MPTSCTNNLNKHSDVTLVSAAKRGDAQAFEELVLRHRLKVVTVALRITKNSEDAEDVAQESFQKAFLHLDTFQEKSLFSTWLTRITMNEAFQLLRRKRGIFEVLPENPENGAKSSSEPFVDQNPNPEESCWRRERMDLLTKAINRLGANIGRTIFLRDIEERSLKETAQILGTTITAVKARVFQGRRRLRRAVNPWFLRGGQEYGRAKTQRC
jgi:RNA polymerase sigma-70 factor, ECF subfamily